MANESTWYGGVDYALPDTTTNALVVKSHLWCLKAMLRQQIAPPVLGPAGAIPGGAAWTCVGSSDSATAALDGTDRWLSSFDATKIVRNVGAHSWMVLQSPTALGPYYLIIDYGTSQDYQCGFYVSKAAPTGGSTTARPTATDETGFANQQFVSASWTSGAGLAHFTTDANGSFWFFASKTGSGSIETAVGVSKLTDNRITGDLFPVCLTVDYGATATGGALREGSSSFYRSGTSGSVRSRSAGNTASINATALTYTPTGSGSAALDTAGVHYYDLKYDAFPVLIYGATTSFKGIKGRMPELRTVPATVLAADRSPATGDIELVCVGNTLVPLTAVPTL